MYTNTIEITMRPAVSWKLYNATSSTQKVAHACLNPSQIKPL